MAFDPGLTFVRNEGAYPSRAHNGTPLRSTPYSQTLDSLVKKLNKDKHASLICSTASDEEKKFNKIDSMFVERKVRYSALFKNLVRWHASAVSLPLSDAILAQLACPVSDIMFCLHSGITNLSLYKHWIDSSSQYKTFFQ
jgi:hypothetical protein